MNTQPGQPFSLVTLSGDRDTVLQYYLSHGFDQAKVEIEQEKAEARQDQTDVSLNVTEGQQVFIDRVLLSGVVKTKPRVVEDADSGASGRSTGPDGAAADAAELYNIALFNEVVAAVQNPTGRRSGEERAAAADRGEAVERDVWVRL